MVPRPYSEKSSLPSDSSNDAITEIPTQVLPETPSPSTTSGATTPSPTPQEQIPVEPMADTVIVQENNRVNLTSFTPCYPTPGDIMPYDHSLPDFIRQITNQPNLTNLHSLSLRVISTLISLHRMSSYLPNLRELNLEGSILNSLRDIGCNLKNLQILKVGRCQLESLDGTFGLSSLRELYAQKNFINDVSPCSNLPHIRHIDVSGNRIRNISYAGFLSVCNKLKSIVFIGNPATDVPGYRKHVRRILPQLETLDGVPFLNEGISNNPEELPESELIENYCEGSDSSSIEVPDFSSVSPSDSMNNFFESEEDAYLLDKKNKQAKNLSNQDQSDGGECEISPKVKANLQFQDDFQNLSLQQNKVKKGLLEQAKIIENRNATIKQKCVSIQKLDKDIENRSKKSNLSLSANFTEEFELSSDKDSVLEASHSSLSSTRRELDSRKMHSVERPSTATGYTSDGLKLEEMKSGAIKKRISSAALYSKNEEQIKDETYGPSQLTTGFPICGNLTAALRNRRKIQNAWDERRKPSYQNERKNESQQAEGHVNGSGDYLDADSAAVNEEDLIEEDVLVASKKWREAFRRFRSNNRARWEEEDESDYTTLLRGTSDLSADRK